MFILSIIINDKFKMDRPLKLIKYSASQFLKIRKKTF